VWCWIMRKGTQCSGWMRLYDWDGVEGVGSVLALLIIAVLRAVVRPLSVVSDGGVCSCTPNHCCMSGEANLLLL